MKDFSRNELIGRLLALSEFRDPTDLGHAPDAVWRAVCSEAARMLDQPEERAITLLRAWIAGCGDEHFSTKEQCRELLDASGQFLASLTPQKSEE